LREALECQEGSMTQDYIHPLQSLRAVMVQKRRTLAESLLSSRQVRKAEKRRKKLIKLQKEIDVIDDAIADEQMLSPALREQVAKDRTDEGAHRQGKVTECVATTAESMERINVRLAELSEHLNEAANAAVSKAKGS
jgi:uncharacterized protein (DUF342 family)